MVAVVTAGVLAYTSDGWLTADSGVGSTSELRPPRPPWVSENGIVDVSKMPDYMPVAGSNGRTLLDNTGTPLCVLVTKKPPVRAAGPVNNDLEPSLDDSEGVEMPVAPPQALVPCPNLNPHAPDSTDFGTP